jgi:hypothetical protein
MLSAICRNPAWNTMPGDPLARCDTQESYQHGHSRQGAAASLPRALGCELEIGDTSCLLSGCSACGFPPRPQKRASDNLPQFASNLFRNLAGHCPSSPAIDFAIWRVTATKRIAFEGAPLLLTPNIPLGIRLPDPPATPECAKRQRRSRRSCHRSQMLVWIELLETHLRRSTRNAN